MGIVEPTVKAGRLYHSALHLASWSEFIVMSWSDILYPDNPKRRAEVIRDIQKLEDYMAQNFRATNKLAEYLNKEMPGANISMISVDQNKSLKENGDKLIKQINEIDQWLDKIDDKLKEELDPELYRKLIDVDTSFEERIEIGKKVGHVIAGIAGVTVTGVVGKIVSKTLTKRLLSSVARIIASGVAGAIAGAIAGLAVDVIAAAIAGAYEKHDLEEAIKDLEKNIHSFIPESEDYTDTVYLVLAEVKVWKRHHQAAWVTE